MIAARLRVWNISGVSTRSRWYKPVCVGLTVVLLGVWLLEVYVAFTEYGWADSFGDDLAVLTRATVRLFTGEEWYQPWQLAGPYPTGGNLVLYPPVAAWFFAPFIWLGPTLFLAIGVGLLVWLVVSWRPAPWAWPLIALCLLVPTTTLKPWSGNPSLYVAVACGMGLRYGWPGALILVKPTFLPFALAGIWTRGWWIAAGALVVLSLPFSAETLRYPEVILNARGSSFLYSVWDWPMALMPIIAWLARSPADPVEAHVGEGRAALGL